MGRKSGCWAKEVLLEIVTATTFHKREAVEWYKAVDGKGMAIWYKATGDWWDKTNLKPNDGISLEKQINDANSLFNYYRHLIAAKQNNPALANGKYATAINDNDKVFSFYRKYKNKEVLVAVNLCGDVQMANFEQGHKKYTPLFGNSKMQNKAVDLDPYQVVVFEVK